MRHIWCCVEETVNPMATVAFHHAVSVRLNIFLNHIPNFSILLTRPDDLNGLAEGFVSDLHEILVLIRNIAHEEGLIEIPMKTTMVDSDIHIADITILQRTHVRDSVTDDLIH